MRQPQGHSWVGEVETDKLVKAPTPPAKTSLLQQADAYPVWAATAYWPCAYLAENGVTGTPSTRHMVEIIPPSQSRAQYAMTVCGTAAGGAALTLDTITGTDVANGAAAAAMNVPWVEDAVRAFLPHSITRRYQLVSGDWDSPAAATSIDRLLSLTTDAAVYVEKISVDNCQSFTLFASRQISDLEAL